MKLPLHVTIFGAILIPILFGCGSSSASVTGQSIKYDTSASSLLIQISRVGGNISPGPIFTLHGNGDLAYQDASSFSCMQGTLSPAQIQSTLQTIVIKDAYFAFTEGKTYGKPGNPDTAQMQIFVHANGQQRTVTVASASDTEAKKLTNMVTYLLQLKPDHPQPCA